jgi:hypothetical protein
MSNVTVGCKVPLGLKLTLGDKSVILAGSNASRIIGGYGLTVVDKDFWDRWSAENATLILLTNGMLFVQESANKAEGQAKEQAEIKSGFERLDLNKPAPGIQAEAFQGKAAA